MDLSIPKKRKTGKKEFQTPQIYFVHYISSFSFWFTCSLLLWRVALLAGGQEPLLSLTPLHTIPCHTMPCHATPRHAIPRHAMPCHATPYHTMQHLDTPCDMGLCSFRFALSLSQSATDFTAVQFLGVGLSFGLGYLQNNIRGLMTRIFAQNFDLGWC